MQQRADRVVRSIVARASDRLEGADAATHVVVVDREAEPLRRRVRTGVVVVRLSDLVDFSVERVPGALGSITLVSTAGSAFGTRRDAAARAVIAEMAKACPVYTYGFEAPSVEALDANWRTRGGCARHAGRLFE